MPRCGERTTLSRCPGEGGCQDVVREQRYAGVQYVQGYKNELVAQMDGAEETSLSIDASLMAAEWDL